MAEATVTFVIEQLTSIAVERIKEEVSLVKNCKSDIKNLRRNFEIIEAVLKDAEQKQYLTEERSSIKLWLENLKEASLEIDNVLDEWNTAILKLKIQKESGEEEDEDVGDHKAITRKKERFCSLFSCFVSKVNDLALRHDIAHKIKDLNKTQAEIASQIGRFNLNATITQKGIERPRTISLVDETEVEGRDVEKEILVSKLLGENSTHHDQGLQIIPSFGIFGMGGLGKTTLAQLVYNDAKVIAHFDLRMWVCVSDPFDEIVVAKAIIESAERKTPDINELEILMQRIVKCVSGKRFLLVLDDVWTKEREKWHKLKLALKAGAVGSKIVITTRKKEVVMMMGAMKQMMTLEKLSDESCWLVFKRRAFSERNDDERRQLEEIGRRIANKSKGLPLVAKALGSLMHFKKNDEWEAVLNSKLWSSMLVDEIFTPFLIGYLDLHAREKICFSYCSVLQKDEEIKRDRLIKMWMSQNYIREEKEGLECFENLAMRSFFQDFERGVDASIISCKMHDIVHDFAQFLRKSECIAIEVHNDGRQLNFPDEKAHHLTLALHSGGEIPSFDYSERNKTSLRTLILMSHRQSVAIDCLFLQLICLRYLSLVGCGIKILPASIGDMKHLRYLELQWNPLEALPESLCDLCNLQTLDLQYCRSLLRLPKGIGKLINLRHLLLAGCDKLEGLPNGIVKLTSLRSLDTLFVSEHKDMLFDFGDLKRFRNIQLEGELVIKKCRNLGSKDDGVKQLDLKKISQHCETLNLQFGEDEIGFDEDSAILEGLEPHQKLQALWIESYMGTTVSPSWMASLINLTEIYLYYCSNCEMLPSLGKLPCLEKISFSGLESVKMVGPEFLGITKNDTVVTSFPKLRDLRFFFMPEWEKWDGTETVNSSSSIKIMPCLATLCFWNCPVLQVVPDFLKTMTWLKELDIRWSNSVEDLCKRRTGNEWDKISHVPNIKLDEEYVQKDGIWIEEPEEAMKLNH